MGALVLVLAGLMLLRDGWFVQEFRYEEFNEHGGWEVKTRQPLIDMLRRSNYPSMVRPDSSR